MDSTFNTKFFIELNTLRLSYARIDNTAWTYIFMLRGSMRRHWIALNPIKEEVLDNVCLHGINDEYQVFLKNLRFPSSSKLMEASR